MRREESGLTSPEKHFPFLYSSVSGRKERLAVEADWHDYDELASFSST